MDEDVEMTIELTSTVVLLAIDEPHWIEVEFIDLMMSE